MKATISPSAGYCIVGHEDNLKILALLPLEEVDTVSCAAASALIRDWEVIEGDSREDIISQAQILAASERCARLLLMLLMAKTDKTKKHLLSEFELHLGTYASTKEVCNRILVAPLRDTEELAAIAMFSAVNGFSAATSLANSIINQQPLLRRLSDIWIDISAVELTFLNQTKQEFWCFLCKEGYVSRLLEAESYDQIKEIFGALAFMFNAPQERTALAKIGELIASQIYGSGAVNLTNEVFEDEGNSSRPHEEPIEQNHSEFTKVLSEVEAIVELLARGDDYHAHKYLGELVERQITRSSSTEYAVKSLCNVAKSCAEMFRTDFEGICVSRAFELDPTDSWTMIQFADHLKRVGDFTKAEDMARRALTYVQHEVVAISLLADINAMKGDHEAAIAIYKQIDNWERTPEVMTAIADNYRRRYMYQEALNHYLKIESLGFGSHRTQAGIAEIARREGRIRESLSIYMKISKSQHLDDRSSVIYELAKASLHKQLGEYRQAFILLEDVIVRSPFLMQARVLKSTVSGLVGKEQEGLQGLLHPDLEYDFSGRGEWLHEYARGLLLLKTNRYKDAQKVLVKNANNLVLEREEREILRIAAAISYIASGETDLALEEIGDFLVGDELVSAHLDYIKTLLQYHIRIVQKDELAATECFKRLSKFNQENIYLFGAFKALQAKKTDEALRYEIDAMLSLAAA